jgi:predicted nucleic acid-binding protein
MECVLDCSLALAWVLPDETSGRADRLLRQVSGQSGLWVPSLWWYELANALVTVQRQSRLPAADVFRAVELYRLLPIRTDSALNADAAWRFQTLAHAYALSAYDAAYLELAQRRGVALATLDRGLSRAATKAGVELIRL